MTANVAALRQVTELVEQPSPTEVRRIVHRTRGQRRGPITRLVSPSDVGELIKPFVFLDFFDVEPSAEQRFSIHPHSGIATFTLLLNGSMEYEDTTGQSGVLDAGGVEWMRAGGGVWHDGRAVGAARLQGLQLWVALPAQLENAAPESQYLAPEQVARDGSTRVALGRYGNARSLVRSPESLTYLHVTLRDGERWRFEPPAGHDVAWVFPYAGELSSPETVPTGELAVFEQSKSAIEFVARGETGFVLGSAIKHPHDLVLGYYSVHTSEAALIQGEAEIERIGRHLRAQGRLG